MAEKKVPQRMCIVCRQMFDKKELVRILKTEEGIVIDETGKKNGRGAYICLNGCADKLQKSRALDRTFKASIEPSVYESIVEELKKIAR